MKKRRSASVSEPESPALQGPAGQGDAQDLLGNAMLAQLASAETRDGPGDSASGSGGGGAHIEHVELASLNRDNAMQFSAWMECHPVDMAEPSPYEGEHIREHLSVPFATGMRDSDLVRDAGMPQTVDEAMAHVSAGDAGTFTVDEFGQFRDYHGGHGFDTGDFVEWFTPAALQRGIRWTVNQRYTHGRDNLGRFRIERTIDSRVGLTVTKTPLE